MAATRPNNLYQTSAFSVSLLGPCGVGKTFLAEPVLAGLKDDSTAVRLGAAQALLASSKEDAAEPLLEMLADGKELDDDLHFWASKTVHAAFSEVDPGRFLAALRSGNDERAYATRSLLDITRVLE